MHSDGVISGSPVTGKKSLNGIKASAGPATKCEKCISVQFFCLNQDSLAGYVTFAVIPPGGHAR